MTEKLKVLMIGDVVGKPGRRAVEALVPGLRQEHGIDLVIARFLTQTPRRLNLASGPARFNSVLIAVDRETGLASSTQRVDREMD